MKYRTVTFTRTRWLPQTGDHVMFEIDFAQDTEGVPSGGVLTVKVSGTIRALWGLSQNDLGNVLLDYARDLVMRLGRPLRVTETFTLSNGEPWPRFDPKHPGTKLGESIRMPIR